MRGGKGAGGEPGDGRRDHQRGDPAQRRMQAPQPRAAQRREHRDQRRGRREGHLEAGAHQRLGAQDQDDHRGQRHRAQRQRAAVEQDRGQHHRHHDEGALGRDIAARQREVERAGGQRHDGGDPVHGPAQRGARPERQPVARGGEDEARQHAHVQARDRQKMREVGDPQRLQRGLVHARAVAGGEGGGEGAEPVRQMRLDVARDGVAHPVDQEARPPLLGRRPGQRRGAGVADRAQAVEPGLPLEVVAARLDRTFGAAQMAGEHHREARLRRDEALVAVQRDPDPRRRPVGIDPFEQHPVEGQPGLVRGGAVDLDHPALDRPVVAEFEHRCRDEMGPQARHREARQREAEPDQQRRPQAEMGDAEGRQRADRGQREPVRLRRLEPQREVGGDARAHADRRPGQEMAALPVEQRRERTRARQQDLTEPPHPCPLRSRQIHRPDPCAVMVAKRLTTPQR